MYEFKTILPNSEVRNNNTFGVLELALNNGSYAWRFVPVAGAPPDPATGEPFTDSGSGDCH